MAASEHDAARTPAPPKSRCSRCGEPFHCGMNDPGGCWCAQLPPLPVDAIEATTCLCPRCLNTGVAAREVTRS